MRRYCRNSHSSHLWTLRRGKLRVSHSVSRLMSGSRIKRRLTMRSKWPLRQGRSLTTSSLSPRRSKRSKISINSKNSISIQSKGRSWQSAQQRGKIRTKIRRVHSRRGRCLTSRRASKLQLSLAVSRRSPKPSLSISTLRRGVLRNKPN